MEIVSKENFKDFIKKHVKNGLFINIDLPKNNKEFFEFTKNIYGIGLYCDVNVYGDNKKYYCSYQIFGTIEDVYCKNKVYKLWEKKFSQYDGLKVLLNSLFGELYCGGVATYHYGQTRPSKKQFENIKNWNN